MFNLNKLLLSQEWDRQTNLTPGGQKWSVYPLQVLKKVTLMPRREGWKWQGTAPALMLRLSEWEKAGGSEVTSSRNLPSHSLNSFSRWRLSLPQFRTQPRLSNREYHMESHLKLNIRAQRSVKYHGGSFICDGKEIQNLKGFCDLPELTQPVHNTKARLLPSSPVYCPWYKTTHESPWKGNLELQEQGSHRRELLVWSFGGMFPLRHRGRSLGNVLPVLAFGVLKCSWGYLAFRVRRFLLFLEKDTGLPWQRSRGLQALFVGLHS